MLVAGIGGGVTLDAGPAPVPAGFPAHAVPASLDADEDTVVDAGGDAQARTVIAEDDRIYGIVSDTPGGTATSPYEVPAVAPSIVPTVVLTPRAAAYDLPALERLGAAQRQPDGAWMITRSVLVGRDAQLRIEEPGGRLLMASGTAGFASIVAFKGTLVLAGAPGAPLTVTGWDPAAGAADVLVDDGRSYLRSVGGRMDLREVRATDLGFWSGRTGGVAWTGSAGEPGAGAATATTVERSHYGMFTSRVADLMINGGAVRDNAVDGLLVHRESAGLTVRDLEATGNARHGIAVSAGTQRITLSGVTTSANGGSGIRIDGAALAASASAGGASTEPGRGFTVEASTATGNAEVGILAVGTAGLVLRDNAVSGSPDGIVVRGASVEPQLTGNSVVADGFGIAVRDGVTGARLAGNRVGPALIAVQVADAVALLRDNTVDQAGRYAVSLVGATGGSEVAGNRLGGRGPAAVDVHRVAIGQNVTVGGNDAGAWVVDRDDLQYWSGYVADHPLILLWLLILALPVLARWRARRRQAQRGTHPYAHLPPGPSAGTEAVPWQATLTPVDRVALARAVAGVGPGGRKSRPGHPPVPPHLPAESTTLLPITRVTVVSGDGAAP